MKIAVEGCAHGELDKIYETLGELERQNNIKVDLLIICGDFQSVRNPADLECMAVPAKYRELNTFYKYYSGEKVAPVLTLFVGGNHEASNYLLELSYGGWVCPNIYYMGYANVINVGGVRIAGLSGIFKGRDYLKGHFEHPPYEESAKKSAYHVRNLDVFRLKQIKGPLDICISHDWPKGVYNHGNLKQLLKFKPFFREEMENNQLGSQPAEELLTKLKPSYWFAAHLHCKFTAIVPHEDPERPETKFLALDKCLPKRRFLQILDVNKGSGKVELEYDPEWLCILQSTNHLLSTSRRNTYMPGPGSSERWDFIPTNDEIEDIRNLFQGDFKVPENFCVTAPIFNPSNPQPSTNKLQTYINPQTKTYCSILNITDPNDVLLNKTNESFSISDFSGTDTDFSCSTLPSFNPDEVSLSDVDDSLDASKPDLNSSESRGFVVDRTGSNDDPVDGFYIDIKGNQDKDIPDSDIFFIDRVGHQPSPPSFTDLPKKELEDFSIDSAGSSPIASKKANTFLHSNQLCSTPILHNKSEESFPEIKNEVTDPEPEKPVEEVTPTVKKFKRRNYDLYKSECDT
ncbi:hypothetical protein JTE90_005991 [Oedothorax gibbosus]|uniref:Lariat debranching enzyme C-terminal domain-containing protein n=1 Tax=Oedothorax gibbosus TaxID=931172 RepID=A0AAV6UXU6_9ARAC|nr:hypothetical protein JTE90_005991 [Oedothorax gibbosus]